MGKLTDFGTTLTESGLLYQTGELGVYGRSQRYARIVTALDELVNKWGTALGATEVQFPPVVSRGTFEQTNFIQSFPNLIGVVHVFSGDDREHAELYRRAVSGEVWSDLLEPSEVFLSSAACHPVYPMCAGTVPETGRYFDVESYCFRHEPSTDPARMQSFQMHEIVFIGTPEAAQEHRDSGLALGVSQLESLGLDITVMSANDPFFGRLGTAMAALQENEVLKLEGVAPIGSEKHTVAIISGNCHRDHFGSSFGIAMPDGTTAHSACVAYGVDRIALALLWRHGLDPDDWPHEVKDLLWP
jgi:seryl-tRNA synthetase